MEEAFPGGEYGIKRKKRKMEVESKKRRGED